MLRALLNYISSRYTLSNTDIDILNMKDPYEVIKTLEENTILSDFDLKAAIYEALSDYGDSRADNHAGQRDDASAKPSLITSV